MDIQYYTRRPRCYDGPTKERRRNNTCTPDGAVNTQSHFAQFEEEAEAVLLQLDPAVDLKANRDLIKGKLSKYYSDLETAILKNKNITPDEIHKMYIDHCADLAATISDEQLMCKIFGTDGEVTVIYEIGN